MGEKSQCDEENQKMSGRKGGIGKMWQENFHIDLSKVLKTFHKLDVQMMPTAETSLYFHIFYIYSQLVLKILSFLINLKMVAASNIMLGNRSSKEKKYSKKFNYLYFTNEDNIFFLKTKIDKKKISSYNIYVYMYVYLCIQVGNFLVGTFSSRWQWFDVELFYQKIINHIHILDNDQ